MRQMILLRRLSTVRSGSIAYIPPNWLEKNCGDVPVHIQPQDSKASEMLRGGHALQVACAKMLDAQVSVHAVKTYASADTKKKLKDVQVIENKALQRINDAVASKDFRFRPSFVLPAIELSSFVVGSVLGTFGDTISISYVKGVKTAVSEYYNDQIREIYATKPEMVELKELFKVARDEEQEFVDAHTPDILNPNDSADPVASFAKTSLKALVQIAKFV